MIKNRMRWVLPLLLLSSCGDPNKATPSYPQIISERLQQQIDRMLPLVQWTCNGRIPTDRQNADCYREGDAISITGWVLLHGTLGSWSAINDSIDQDGRPWRNPARIGRDDDNSFSRDQMLGLLEATVASGNRARLLDVMRYVQTTGRLCPGDDRCNLTGPIVELTKLVLGEKTSAAERAAAAWITIVEAQTVPAGYQVHLVGRKILLYARLNSLLADHQKTASILKRRFPTSLYVRAVDAVANGKDFVPIAEDLAACMEQWEGPGNAWWGEEIERGCQKRSYGHEYIALARFLLQSKEFKDD